MKTILLLICCIFCQSTNNPLKKEEPTLTKNSYIQKYSTKEFFNTELSEQALDPEQFDEELFIATLYFLVHKRKSKSKYRKFELNIQLQKGAEILLSDCSTGRMRYVMRKKRLPKRNWKKVVRQGGWQSAFLNMAAVSLPIYDFPKRFKVAHKPNEEGPDFSYKVRTIWKPVYFHTYHSLAKKMIERGIYSDQKALLRSKALSQWACSIRIDQKDEKSLPYLSVIILGGGYRLGLLEEDN